jgi:hypothetical protein
MYQVKRGPKGGGGNGGKNGHMQVRVKCLMYETQLKLWESVALQKCESAE